MTLTAGAWQLWHAIGRELAAVDGLIVMTGGRQARTDGTPLRTGDRALTEGMRERLTGARIDLDSRIETYLTESSLHAPSHFKLGRVGVQYLRSLAARRLAMVRDADTIITLAGEGGTRSVIDAALAFDRPVLPIPSAGGSSLRFWSEVRSEIIARFAISESEERLLECNVEQGSSPVDIDVLAGTVVQIVMRGFSRTCFVMMPFDSALDPVYQRAIKPAAMAAGFAPIRTDDFVRSGDVTAAIRDGIRNCAFAIADLTMARPNVMYEIGLAHACGKPVLLLQQETPTQDQFQIPFDVSTHQIHRYRGDDTGLSSLQTLLQTLVGEFAPRGLEQSDPLPRDSTH